MKRGFLFKYYLKIMITEQLIVNSCISFFIFPTKQSPPPPRRAPIANTLIFCRVSNLTENAQEADIQELFKSFGNIARVFLAKDKTTGNCKVGH